MTLSFSSHPANFKWAFEENSNNHETSLPLMQAIEIIAGGDAAICERVWSQPTDTEIRAIESMLFQRNLNIEEMFWGTSGSSWTIA